MFDLYQKKQIVDVTTYVRPFQTVSYGPLNGLNTMVIEEELITVLPDGSTTNVPQSQLHAEISDPNQSFDVVNPVTGEVTGTKTFAQLKIEMYSLYLYLASIRDAG